MPHSHAHRTARQRQSAAVLKGQKMGHIHEVAEAERQRAIHDADRYGGGYAIYGQAPVIIGSVRPAPESDDEARMRLARQVGELQATIDRLRADLHAETSPTPPDAESDVVDVPYGKGHVTVAYTVETDDDERGVYTHYILQQVWICGQWIDGCELGGLAETLQERLQRAVEEASA